MPTKLEDMMAAVLPVITRPVILENMPLMVFRQFTTQKTDTQALPSDKIRFLKLGDLSGGGMLPDEDTPIANQKMGLNYVEIALAEFGNGVKMSRKALEMTPIPLLTDASTLLVRNELRRMDEYFRDIFLSTANKIYYKADGTSGTAMNEVARVFDDKVLKDAIEILETLDVPQFNRNGDLFWACIATPHVIRQLRDTSYWTEAHKYVNPELIWNGEVGRIEDVIFFKKSNMPVAAGAGAGAVDVHRTVLFGGNSVGEAIASAMEIIPAAAQDYNRWQGLAWYEIVGGGIIQDNIVEIATKE